jgi:general secretion pathway protein A
LRLQRGMSLVLADVGMGKTTLSRKLMQVLKTDPQIHSALIFNPVYENEKEFLEDLLERFHLPFDRTNRRSTVLEMMKTIEKYLFESCVEQDGIVMLLIDEAQKLSDPCLEILRSLLNYETNDRKIFQLVLMGQMELLPRISGIHNLWDRIAMKQTIPPLDEEETGELIGFRLLRAGSTGKTPLFDAESIAMIYKKTGGYPRRIAMLCHSALQQLVMRRLKRVEAPLMEELTTQVINTPANVLS